MHEFVTLEEAQARLKEIILLLMPGQDVVITENDRPVARLVCEQPKVFQSPRAGPGICKGEIYMAPDFDAPLEDLKEYME